MKKYMKLARITAWPASLFSFAVGFGAGATRLTSWEDGLFGLAAVLSFFAFAFALNFYSDRDVDRYHPGRLKDVKLSEQPLLTGDVTERECGAFCALTFLLAVAFGWFAGGLVALLMLLASLVGGVLYSHPWVRLKGKPVADILCMSCLSAILFSAGFVVARGAMPTWPMFLFFSMFSAVIYIPTVVGDYEYDIRAGLKTSAVVFGQRNLLKAMWVIWLCSLPISWYIISGQYVMVTKVCVIVACVASAAYAATAWRSLRPGGLLMPLVSSHPRGAIMSLGAVSLLFICWGWFKVLSHGPIP